MSESPHPDHIEFKILPEDGGHEVPVALLLQGLQGLQQLIQFSALSIENRTVRQRVRIPAEIQQRYTLHCKPPEKGSFKISGRVGDLRGSLVPTGDVRSVMDLVYGFSRATRAAEESKILTLVPDSRLRVRMLDCLRTMAPPLGAGYAFEFSNCIGAPVRVDEIMSERIELFLRSPEPAPSVRTITGKLSSISFSEHCLSIIYAPKLRTLECIYDESLEPMLFENRRDLIQVTGQVVDADDGHPRKIVEVSRIEELDLSPFVITEFIAGIPLIEPLRMEPFLSEDEQLLHLENASLDINVFATTRSELLYELRGQLSMLWNEFALEADSALSAPAQQLKIKLLSMAKEGVENATR